MTRIAPGSLAGLLAIAASLERNVAERCQAICVEIEAGERAEPTGALARLGAEAAARAEALTTEACSMGIAAAPSPSELRLLLADIELEPPLDDHAGRSLYRALAWVVESHRHAFRIFSYLAAHAGGAEAGRRAERLAQDKLDAAALARRERRLAYHRDRTMGRPDARALAGRVQGVEDLRAAAWALEDSIAACLADTGATRDGESLRITRKLILSLGSAAESDEGLVWDVGGLVSRSGGTSAALGGLDRAFDFYDAVLTRAASEETLILAQRLAEASLERIGLLRRGPAVDR